jgi:two-component system, NarL family, response regulator NreC
MPIMSIPKDKHSFKLAVVEDEPLFCEVLRQVINESTEACIAATVTNGREAARYLMLERPDAVVLDLGLPDLDGFSLIKETRRHSPKTRFLVVTANSDDYTMFRLYRARVQGVVDKRSEDLTSLRTAVLSFVAGGDYFSKSYQDAAQRREQMTGLNAARLTEREREVLMLAGLGLSNSEIGRRLQISAETAERHRSNLFRKLDVRRTPKLMELASKAGFTRIPPGGHGPPVYS